MLRYTGFSLRWLLLLRSTGSRYVGFSSCGTRALLLCSMWDLPGPGLEPVSPALASGFLTTAPPGKPLLLIFFFFKFCFHIFVLYNSDFLFLNCPLLRITCSYFMDLISYLTEYIDCSTFGNVFFPPCTASVSSKFPPFFFFNQFAFDLFFHGRGCSQTPGPLLAILLQLDILCPWIL